MTKYRESKAPITTSTYDKNEVEGETNNIYEALSIIAKRSMQINLDIKKNCTKNLKSLLRTTIAWKRFSKTKSKSKYLNSMKVFQNRMHLQ